MPLLGPWIEYICQVVAEVLATRWSDLSPKARPADGSHTQIYWIEAVNHSNFKYINQQVRDTFNKCLEANCKLHENMRILKIREMWDKRDDKLVINNRLTKYGVNMYWKAADLSFKFNLLKHEEFVIRSKFRALKKEDNGKMQVKKFAREDADLGQSKPKRFGQEDDSFDEVENFFRWKRNNRFHWNSSTGRFLLPKPKPSCFTNN